MSSPSAKTDLVLTENDAPFEMANRLFFRLYQCSNLMHKNGTQRVSEVGATTQQWAVLGALARSKVHDKGMTVKELIEFLMVSRQNLTAVLDRLEDRGWIERTKDPEDGRSRIIRMTETGDGVWTRMQDTIRRFYGEALSGFSGAEVDMLVDMLSRLRTGLTET